MNGDSPFNADSFQIVIGIVSSSMCEFHGLYTLSRIAHIEQQL